MATRSTQRNLGRLSEIAQVAARHGFGYFFETHRVADHLPFRHRELDDDDRSQRGVRLREMFDELGPTFVKFGQLLSMRPDVLPPDIIVELRRLQDDVTPFPFDQVEQVVVEELGLTVEQLFIEFEPAPVASASIGQVHRAVLPNGKPVAVKVQRPDAPRQIDADLNLMMQAARLVRERVKALEFVDPAALVDEFARQIRGELDYRLEARNAESFRRNFAGEPQVVVPKVYWSYTRSRVLTLELLDGPQLADIGPDDFSAEERRALAYLVTETWMTMIFRHGLFHGDPHPANILVLAPDRIGLVDFGAAGNLTDQDMTAATRLFIDAATENVDALPKRLTDLGVRYPKENEETFRTELRDIYYRYYRASLSEIDPMQVIREAFALIYTANLRLPTRFLMLDKAIATLASVGAELYPDFNVFEVAKPFARDLMKERFAPDRVIRRARKEALALSQVALELPYQVHDILEEMRDGQIEVGFRHIALDEFMLSMQESFNRLVVALVVAAGFLGSAVLAAFAKGGPHALGVNVIALAGFTLSTIVLFRLLWAVLRRGRL